jgi:hypothetical protein
MVGALTACGSSTTTSGDLGPTTDAKGGGDSKTTDSKVWPDQGPVPCGGKDCNDGLGCTKDVCINNQCVNTLQPDACLIDGACYGDGDKKTPTGCAVCDPKTSDSAWTDSDAACPDDLLDCTTARCTSGTCSQELQAGFCQAGDLCIADGATDPQDNCQVCDTSKSTTTLQEKPDGTPCTADNLSCTLDECQAGSCKHPPKPDTCLIGGVCYVKGEVNPFLDCQACDPALDSKAWSMRPDGSKCTDDKLACTDDLCVQGVCKHTVQASACLIGGNCFTPGATNPSAECEHCDPTVDKTAWTQKPDGTACTSDNLSCTDDVCGGGKCVHPVGVNVCLIGGVCYAPMQKHPTLDCQGCVPSATATAWSILPDGTACTADTLSCTDDVCHKGTCAHDLKADHCLISGTCYARDALVSGQCMVCAPMVTTSAATFAAGRPCDDGSTSTGIDTCLTGTCRGFVANTWEWLSTDTNTVMNGVAFVPGSGAAWAVGSYEDSGGASGFIARLNGPSVAPSNVAWDETPFNAIHDRAAVGDQGQVRFWDTSSWITPGAVEGHMGAGTNVRGVWGVTLTGLERTLYLAATGSRVTRCYTPDNGASWACTDHTGVTGNLRRVFGTVVGASQGPLWAVRDDSWEDIFHNPGSGTSWTTAAPHGCFDSSTNPCGNTSGRFQDLWALSSSEAWAVGEEGMVLRYQSGGWIKVSIPTLVNPPQSSYVFRAVYAQGELVLLLGDRDFNGQWHDMIALFYNRKLDKWYAPRIAFYTAQTDTQKPSYRFQDAGGQSMSSVYLVGSMITSGEQRALFMTLQ